MEEKAKVLKFPGTEGNEVQEETSNETSSFEEGVEVKAKAAIEDPEHPLDEQSIGNIEVMLKNVEQIVQIMESQWMASARELQLKDIHMRKLAAVNDKYKQEPPEHLTEDQRAEWDYLNGIDSITDEDLHEIFEEGHPIYGVDHSQTVDRVKAACTDFFQWLQAMSEYRHIHDAYLQLLELQEEEEIEKLRKTMENEPDEKKRAAMQESINNYYNKKYLEFLAEPLDDAMKDRIVKALSDEKKVEYWINRTRDKLAQLKISSKFILELSQFEKRYLEEKYHKNSNVLLLYFMCICIHQDTGNKNDENRIKTICIVLGMDAFIRNTWSEERRARMLDNIHKFEDQFLDLVPVPEAAE